MEIITARLTEEEQINYIRSWKPVSRWQEQSGIVWESYMTEKAIRHIEELDYPYRQEYENWLNSELTRGTKVKYLTGFDWIKRHAIREKQIHCWEETRRYYMKIKYGFLLYYQIRK